MLHDRIVLYDNVQKHLHIGELVLESHIVISAPELLIAFHNPIIPCSKVKLHNHESCEPPIQRQCRYRNTTINTHVRDIHVHVHSS